MTPRITVLMSVYNGERHLREAVASILRQSCTDFEFLIIDDGSDDGSVAIIEEFADPRIRLVRNSGNLGLSSALNRGLRLARGEYVARMDADDISRPERLALQLAFMDSHPRVGVCGSWVRFFPREKQAVWRLPEHCEEIRCWQFHGVGVAHPSVMLRRRLFAEHGLSYDPNCRYAQDYELWGRALRHMDFSNIRKVLLDYRISKEQTGARHAAGQLEVVAPLRLQRVRELGLEPAPEERLLHEQVMNGALPAEAACLDRAEQWLAKLEAANRAGGVYARQCFARRLLDLWFASCLSLADAGACSLARCLRSPLWDTAQHAAWHRARALAAWTQQKGLWATLGRAGSKKVL